LNFERFVIQVLRTVSRKVLSLKIAKIAKTVFNGVKPRPDRDNRSKELNGHPGGMKIENMTALNGPRLIHIGYLEKTGYLDENWRWGERLNLSFLPILNLLHHS